MEHLRIFDTINDYDNYQYVSPEYVQPNVSYINNGKFPKVMYKKNYQSTLKLTYNCTDDNLLGLYKIPKHKKIKIDDEYVSLEVSSSATQTLNISGNTLASKLGFEYSEDNGVYFFDGPIDLYTIDTSSIVSMTLYNVNEDDIIMATIPYMPYDDNTCVYFGMPMLISDLLVSGEGIAYLQGNDLIINASEVLALKCDGVINDSGFTLNNFEDTTLKLDMVNSTPYFFNEKGKHTIEITFNSDYINEEFLYDKTNFISPAITQIEIDEKLKFVNTGVFSNLNNLDIIKSNAINAPEITSQTFYSVKKGGKLIYPKNSNYNQWLSDEFAYLGYYKWNKTPEYIITCEYDIQDNTGEILLCNRLYDGYAYINNETINTSSDYQVKYKFNTTGKHVVKFNMYTNEININQFKNCINLTSVIIEGNITSISNNAFENCTSLTSITIPDSVTSIKSNVFKNCNVLPIEDNIRYADWIAVETINKTLTTYNLKSNTKILSNSLFEKCTSLTSITIPDSVTTIGGYAFYGCSSLTSVTIGDSVTTIGEWAFYGCDGLTSVTIGDSVTTIGGWAFCDCDGLTSVTIPDSVTTIGRYAFAFCRSLTSVTIGDSVTTIGGWAFYRCDDLTSVTIQNSVTTIGDSAFCDCINLTSVTIPDSVTTIGREAFKNCESLTSVIIPKTISKIETWTFESCSKLSSVILPDTLKEIGNGAFNSCYNLTNINLPNGLIKIQDYALYDTAIKNINIPSTVTYIGESQFDCKKLEEITVSSNNINYYVENDCLIEAATKKIIVATKNATIIPNDIITIGSSAFHDTQLTSITIPDSVQNIKDLAFAISDLKTLILGKNVYSIKTMAFYGSKLENIKSNNMIAPTLEYTSVLGQDTWPFSEIMDNGVLMVPNGSDYSSWMDILPQGWTIQYF